MDTLGATIGSLFNVVRLFVLFDLISSGSRKNDNLWKSLGGIMVNGAPREVPRVLNGVPREYIEGPPRPDPRPKTLGACGPSGFWPWVWPWGAFNILPRDSIENSRKPP